MDASPNPFCGCLYYSSSALARSISRLADEAFSRTGLGPSLGFVLMAVNQKPGIQPSEVAEVMMLDPSTVTRLVEKLESKGLVRREAQGRTTQVFASDAGQAFLSEIQAAWDRVHSSYADRLGESHAQALATLVYDAALKLSQP